MYGDSSKAERDLLRRFAGETASIVVEHELGRLVPTGMQSGGVFNNGTDDVLASGFRVKEGDEFRF